MILHEQYNRIMLYMEVQRALIHTGGGGKYKAWYFNWQEYLSNYHFSVCSPRRDYVIIFLKHCGTILLFFCVCVISETPLYLTLSKPLNNMLDRQLIIS